MDKPYKNIKSYIVKLTEKNEDHYKSWLIRSSAFSLGSKKTDVELNEINKNIKIKSITSKK